MDLSELEKEENLTKISTPVCYRALGHYRSLSYELEDSLFTIRQHLRNNLPRCVTSHSTAWKLALLRTLLAWGLTRFILGINNYRLSPPTLCRLCIGYFLGELRWRKIQELQKRSQGRSSQNQSSKIFLKLYERNWELIEEENYRVLPDAIFDEAETQVNFFLSNHAAEENWPPQNDGSDLDLCCICFDQVCKIEVQDCGHQMCAQCMLALCCHNKTNPTTACLTAQVWPFCRSNIAQIVVANAETDVDTVLDATSVKLRKSQRSRNVSEGRSSFKGLSDVGSFSKIGGRGSRRIAAEIRR